jgi:CDP-diacylglycerol---glycerol-3-phosphate 3-phosphatidyltransferase
MISLSLYAVLAVILGVAYYFRASPKTFDRVTSYGSSVLMSKGLMNFGYWLVDGIATFCLNFGLKPNHLTLSGLLFSGLFAFLVFQDWLQLAMLTYWAVILCDACDGHIALKLNMKSKSGEALDSTIDRWVDFLILLGFILFYRTSLPLLLICISALAGSFMVSYVSAKAEFFKAPIPRGLMRRVERTIYIGAAVLLTPAVDWLWMKFELPYAEHHPLIILILGLIGVIANLSAASRLWHLYRNLR